MEKHTARPERRPNGVMCGTRWGVSRDDQSSPSLQPTRRAEVEIGEWFVTKGQEQQKKGRRYEIKPAPSDKTYIPDRASAHFRDRTNDFSSPHRANEVASSDTRRLKAATSVWSLNEERAPPMAPWGLAAAVVVVAAAGSPALMILAEGAAVEVVAVVLPL